MIEENKTNILIVDKQIENSNDGFLDKEKDKEYGDLKTQNSNSQTSNQDLLKQKQAYEEEI